MNACFQGRTSTLPFRFTLKVMNRWISRLGLLPVVSLLLLLPASEIKAQKSSRPSASSPPVQILSFEGNVEISRTGAVDWDPAYTNQVLRPGDRGRTGPRSRVTLRMSDLSVVPIGSRSEFQVEAPPPKSRSSTIFSLLKGIAYFFHRGKPADVEFKSKTATAAIRGTEFSFEVDEQGRTIVTLFDGAVELSNDAGTIQLRGNEQGVAEPGKPPVKTAVIDALNIIQWALYYPGVLDITELALTPNEQRILDASLTAYRSGDLLQALEQYPVDRQPDSNAEKVYLAAVLLAVGQVSETETLLDSIDSDNDDDETVVSKEQRLAAALRWVIRTVTQPPITATSDRRRRASIPEYSLPESALGRADLQDFPTGSRVSKRVSDNRDSSLKLATEWLAESYYLQAQNRLAEALDAARWATEASPTFGFAWERAAELEFGFGHAKAARRALDISLEHAPRNAQALALKGYLLTAQNRVREALPWFDRAIAIDSALGNAWLGRGLCRIRLGKTESGRDDLLVAAAREPQRALFRSYLGKAFYECRDNQRAAHELELAKRLDPRDPTAWLYSALLKQQGNRINEALHDLEQSQELNDNRRVYRSRLLLDQDRAVRGANLARVYQDAGMDEVAHQEAARAVNTDYANFSSHLFLANSYQALRDPRQINLRYETPWLSEYLVANLLAPVGAGVLSPQVSQQEYSRLFERNKLGLVSSTEYFSNGDWIQNASQYGRYGNSAYSLDVSYRSENGHRPNNELEQLSLSARIKQQVTPKDHFYFQAVYYNAEGGDLTPLYDQGDAILGFKFKERQEPLVLAGWHHEWSPGNHTLVLAGRLEDRLDVTNPEQRTLLLTRGSMDEVVRVRPMRVEQEYRSDTTIYTAEAQQIVQGERNTVIAGMRYQNGEYHTSNRHRQPEFVDLSPILGLIFQRQLDEMERQTLNSDFERISFYAYDQWQVADPLMLVAGFSYDSIKSPNNFRYSPLASGESRTDQVSPKAGLIWTPFSKTVFRGAYSRSLGGVGFDHSFQLEPTQVAGFNQAWRSILPEAVAGANAVPVLDTAGVSLEQKLGSGTYLSLSGQWLRSEVERDFGAYDAFGRTLARGQTRQDLDFEERTLMFTFNQLIGREWSFGARYRLSQADLTTVFSELSPTADFRAGAAQRNDWKSVLHQVNLEGRYTHRCGFFSIAEAIWNKQSNHGYAENRPGDDFWQFNLYAGYRFPRRQAEVRLGLLNLTDRDYQLNPLNLTAYLPRDRTLTVSFKFNL